MKKTTIWVIAILMGIFFLALLYMQTAYLNDAIKLRKLEIETSVGRTLAVVGRQLELTEAQHSLESTLSENERDSSNAAVYAKVDDLAKPFETLGGETHIQASKGFVVRNSESLRIATQRTRNELRRKLELQKDLLNEVAYNILKESSNRPLKERIDFDQLDRSLKAELQHNGINIPYHFTVTTADGTEIYRCADYTEEGNEDTYTQKIFPNDSPARIGYINIHFPEMEKYIFRSARFIVPAIAFTFVLLMIFIYTIYTIFRQKRLTEMKNDFINNMTHEFKTPISSISLAAQMLKDPMVVKNETMFKHLAKVINDETNRLRFQVEKILQLSMFSRNDGSYKQSDLDTHHLINDVVDTFRLKVESMHGCLETKLNAQYTMIYADKTHITNVLFNLLDNAVKYKDAERQLDLTIVTKNKGDKILIEVCDNGVGIPDTDLKKIFDRFYRVHTGNRHDVKGFGLGLSYVKTVVDYHKGTIYAESEVGQGTKFIITLPTIKTERL